MSYVELASKYITENDEFYQDEISMARRNGIRDFAAWLDRAAELPLEPTQGHTCPSCGNPNVYWDGISAYQKCYKCGWTGQV